jgi:hypothetical protein
LPLYQLTILHLSHSFFSFEFKFLLFLHYLLFLTLTISNSTHFLFLPLLSNFVLHSSNQPFNFILSNLINQFSFCRTIKIVLFYMHGTIFIL